MRPKKLLLGGAKPLTKMRLAWPALACTRKERVPCTVCPSIVTVPSGRHSAFCCAVPTAKDSKSSQKKAAPGAQPVPTGPDGSTGVLPLPAADVPEPPTPPTGVIGVPLPPVPLGGFTGCVLLEPPVPLTGRLPPTPSVLVVVLLVPPPPC